MLLQTLEESIGPKLSKASNNNYDNLDNNSSSTKFVTYSKPTIPLPRNIRRENISLRQASLFLLVLAASLNLLLVALALN